MKDRAYMIKISDAADATFEEVRLANRVIEGLLSMNAPGRREDPSKDKTFIKALLIATCTLQAIRQYKDEQLPPKGILSFVKGEVFF